MRSRRVERPWLPSQFFRDRRATEIMLGAGTVDGFAAGDMLAVDADYQQQIGYVGSGISAAYVSDPGNGEP